MNFWDTLFWGGGNSAAEWGQKGFSVVLSLPTDGDAAGAALTPLLPLLPHAVVQATSGRSYQPAVATGV